MAHRARGGPSYVDVWENASSGRDGCFVLASSAAQLTGRAPQLTNSRGTLTNKVGQLTRADFLSALGDVRAPRDHDPEFVTTSSSTRGSVDPRGCSADAAAHLGHMDRRVCAQRPAG